MTERRFRVKRNFLTPLGMVRKGNTLRSTEAGGGGTVRHDYADSLLNAGDPLIEEVTGEQPEEGKGAATPSTQSVKGGKTPAKAVKAKTNTKKAD